MIKKLLFILLISAGLNAQTYAPSTPITQNNNLRLVNPPTAQPANQTFVMLWGQNAPYNVLGKFPVSDLISQFGTIPTFQQVLNQGSTASINTPFSINYKTGTPQAVELSISDANFQVGIPNSNNYLNLDDGVAEFTMPLTVPNAVLNTHALNLGQYNSLSNDRVPYTGATQNVDLGENTITAQSINLGTSGTISDDGGNVFIQSDGGVAISGGSTTAAFGDQGFLFRTGGGSQAAIKADNITGFPIHQLPNTGGTYALGATMGGTFYPANNEGVIALPSGGTGGITQVTGVVGRTTVANGSTAPVINIDPAYDNLWEPRFSTNATGIPVYNNGVRSWTVGNDLLRADGTTSNGTDLVRNTTIGSDVSGTATALTASNTFRQAIWILNSRVNSMTATSSKTANYTLTATDYKVKLTANNATFTLPTAVGIAGKEYVLKNSGTGTLTIQTTSGQTIDGMVNYPAINIQYRGVRIQSDGANWDVIGQF